MLYGPAGAGGDPLVPRAGRSGAAGVAAESRNGLEKTVLTGFQRAC
jgi:hypothetical protein